LIDVASAFSVAAVLGAALLSGSLIAPYLVRVYTGKHTFLDRLLDPVEKRVYRILGTEPAVNMGWKQYFFAALILNAVQMAIAIVILMYQNLLPLNPQGFPGMSWDLAFNTVVSFATTPTCSTTLARPRYHT